MADLSRRGRVCGHAAEKQEEEWGARVGASAGTSPGKGKGGASALGKTVAPRGGAPVMAGYGPRHTSAGPRKIGKQKFSRLSFMSRV